MPYPLKSLKERSTEVALQHIELPRLQAHAEIYDQYFGCVQSVPLSEYLCYHTIQRCVRDAYEELRSDYDRPKENANLIHGLMQIMVEQFPFNSIESTLLNCCLPASNWMSITRLQHNHPLEAMVGQKIIALIRYQSLKNYMQLGPEKYKIERDYIDWEKYREHLNGPFVQDQWRRIHELSHQQPNFGLTHMIDHVYAIHQELCQPF